MGGGTSRGATVGGGGGRVVPQDFPEAFAAGKDFAAVGGVDHAARTVSRTTQAEWDNYSATMNAGTTTAQENAIKREYSSTPNHQGGYVKGYVRTQNSFAINEILYDPKNDGASVDSMFKRASDRNTVKTMDKLINSHVTPADASYTRFCSPNAVQATFGLSDAQMSMLKNATKLNPAQLKQLSANFAGEQGFSNAYTSTSANRSLNAFSNPNAKQSKGFIFERKLNVPKGTKAYAPRNNAQESEVIFGRGLKTKITHVSIAPDGHIVIHESYDGYK